MFSTSSRFGDSGGLRLLHPALVPFPVVCFIGAFLTDLAYWRSAEMQWANFAVWLLTAGLVMAGLAGLAALIDLIRTYGDSLLRPAWGRVAGAVLALGLSVINAFVRSRDAYTSVVPTGLVLSGLVVAIVLATGWAGWSLIDRHQTGRAY